MYTTFLLLLNQTLNYMINSQCPWLFVKNFKRLGKIPIYQHYIFHILYYKITLFSLYFKDQLDYLFFHNLKQGLRQHYLDGTHCAFKSGLQILDELLLTPKCIYYFQGPVSSSVFLPSFIKFKVKSIHSTDKKDLV